MRRSETTASGTASVAVSGDVNAPIITNPEVHVWLQETAAPDPSDWPRVNEVDALTLGVHRARPIDNGPVLPPYILRDIDREVARQMKHVAIHGGFVLLVGDSTSGKSRTALHGVQRCMPEHAIYAPSRGTSLLHLPQTIQSSPSTSIILWLDDLEGFLGSEGMNPLLLESLMRLRVAIVATMQDELFEKYANTHLSDYHATQDKSHQIGNRLLRAADPIRIGRLWSPAEIGRASKVSDERIVDAISHSATYGVSEYLASGPALLQSWYRAQRVGGNPRGAALVHVCIDLARAGFSGAVDIDVLEELHVKYLPDPTLRPESWSEALAWATTVQYGVSGLLVPGDYAGTWRAFDYLPDAISRDKETQKEVPDFIREEALNLSPDEDDQWLIGMSAYMAGATQFAIDAWAPLAETGNGSAASNLVTIFHELGDAESARYWHHLESEDEFQSTTIYYDRSIPLYDSESGEARIGRYRTGETVGVVLHRPDSGVRHGVIAGAKGVGKSNNLSLILLGALSSGKYILWLMDWSPEQKHFKTLREKGWPTNSPGMTLSAR